MQLQGTSGLQDITLEALFENCANISHVELTTHSRHGNSRLDGSALDKLREHPHWGTKLKKLRLPNQGIIYDARDSLTKAVRALTKERVKLLVQLVDVSERLLARNGEIGSSRSRIPTFAKEGNRALGGRRKLDPAFIVNE